MSAGHRDCRGWGTCFVTGREYFINIFIFLFLETSGYEQQKQDEQNQSQYSSICKVHFIRYFLFVLMDI